MHVLLDPDLTLEMGTSPGADVEASKVTRVQSPRGGLVERAQVQHLNGFRGIRPKRSAWLVEVRPDEELPANFCVSLRRILVPTALDKASAVALDYTSALARRFGSELALLYAFEGSDYAQSSNIEAKLWTCFSALRLRHLKARVFLRPGPTGEQVKAVVNALGADLIVTSRDYHRRFLSYLTHRESGISRVHGVPCPVVLVNAVCHRRERT